LEKIEFFLQREVVLKRPQDAFEGSYLCLISGVIEREMYTDTTSRALGAEVTKGHQIIGAYENMDDSCHDR